MGFTLIEQLNNVNIDNVLETLRLNKREDFWILKLKTLYPYGLNAEVDFSSK